MSHGDDDFELLNQRPIFGWEEARRDEVMGRAVYQQAANIRAIKATQAADAAQLRAELSNLSGSIENRLGALTRSFGAFVELDAVRQQLAAFPENAKARRQALTDMLALRAGQTPPERPDIEGYWLPAAVAALQPGGGVDQAKAAVAVERDPAAAFFLLIARAALGAGPQVAGEAVRALAPAEGEWNETQQELWRIVAAGGFGPQALAAVLPTLQTAVETEGGWDEWLQGLAGPAGVDGKPSKKKASATRLLEHLGGELTSVLGEERPAGPDFVSAAEAAGDQPEATVVVEDPAPAEPRPDAEALLFALATRLIEEGDREERALLERVELLRLQIAHPGEDLADLPVEAPPRRVVDLVRELAVDESADPAARRQAWRVLLVPIDRWVAEVGAPPPPSPPEVPVVGQSFVARPDGVDDGEVRRAERAIARQAEPSAWTQRAPLMLWGGLGAVVLGVVLIALTSQWAFFLLVVLGAGCAFIGFRLRSAGVERAADAEQVRQRLAREVERATAKAAAEHVSAQAAYEARVGVLEAYRELRRRVG